MNTCWKLTRPVDEFVSSSIFLRNVALHHLLSNGSSAVNGCHQNESPNSWWAHILAISETHRFWHSLRMMLTDGLEWCGLLVDYCDVFISCFGLSFWRHPFTAEHPLVSKWCNATFIWWRNKLIYILDGLRVRAYSANFHFFQGSRSVHEKPVFIDHKYKCLVWGECLVVTALVHIGNQRVPWRTANLLTKAVVL